MLPRQRHGARPIDRLQLLFRRLPRGLRATAWRAIHRLPPRAQRLIRDTGEHRRWKMQQLYARLDPPRATAPTVIFWIPGGMHLLLHVETAIAAALRLRGVSVHAIICDSPYRACARREATDGIPVGDWHKSCPKCIASNREVLELMGIPYSSVGDFVPTEIRQKLRARAEQCTLANVLDLSHNNVSIGRNVLSAVNRYLQGSSAEIDDQILREYAFSALVCAEAAGRVFDRFNPIRVLMSHGVYVDWGPALHTAVRRGIPVTTWKSSYLTARFFFRQVSDGRRIDFYKMSDPAWHARAATSLTDEEEESLATFLYRRYHHGVSFDMRAVHKYTGETERFRRKYQLEPGKPVWGIMAHINWDSVSDYSPMAYASLDDWMIDTVDQVSRIPDVQWLIKIHPTEREYDANGGVQRLIETRFPNLPSNVKVIPADEEISPLEFFDVIDGGVTVYGTSGLELAASGKPVILAGEAHYSGKGFTEDGLDVAAYRKLLSLARCIGPLTPEQARRARQYAYSLFIQRQIPLPLVRDPRSTWWSLQHERRNELLPGAEPFISFICERLMDGQDFVMDRDLAKLAESEAWHDGNASQSLARKLTPLKLSTPVKSLNRYARTAAHIAIQKSPASVQALFSHTDENRKRKMSRLYAQGRPAAPSQGTLLFWVPGGMPLLLHVEASIAAAMKLRGYDVHAIICNSPYRGCTIRTVQEGIPIERWADVCTGCVKKTSRVLEMMGIPYSYNGDFVTEAERDGFWERTAGITWENLDELCYHGINVGRNIRSSIVRYLQGAPIEGNEAAIREYAFSGLVSAAAAERALERFKPWRVFMSHGVYVDWGPALHRAHALGIPVTAWKSSYLPWHFYMRDVADPTRIDLKKFSAETWEEIRKLELTPHQNARLDKFFKDRYEKQITFDMKEPKDYRTDISDIKAKYAPGDKPVWAVLAHINWDSVLDYAPMAYPAFDDWMLDTIRQAIGIPEIQWLIKIHPIEAWNKVASGVRCLIEKNFPNLPDYVRIIPAEEDISPTNMFELIDGGVTVYGTSGLELALLGKPVILAGEAHYGGRGFTHEGLTPEAYRDLLRRAPCLGRLTEEQRALARKYAYSHFIQRQVPMEILHDPKSKWWNLQHEKRDLLLPGNDPFIDFICDRLIDGCDFNMDDSLVALSERELSPQSA